jgi:hypothetical protein
MVYSPQRRRDAETSAEILGTDGPVVEGDGQPESVILTRRRGDAEISAEKRRSQREDERGDSGGWWPSVWSGRVSAEILGTYDGNLGLDGCCLARRKRSPSSARIGRLKPAPPRLWGRALLMGMMAVALGAQSDGERQLETAVYREAVMGDVAAAIGMYRAILAQQGMARPVAARALWQLGQCQEKLGQRREAHATYARLAREYAAESGIAAQARGKLAGWSDALPGPRNLRFEEGDAGKTPPGWFVPQVEKISGSLAELRRKGCRSNVGCAVVIAPATAAASDSVGNLMQSFRAAAYRGKTVRLRAWVRVEAGGPGDRAQMWLRVDRPNGKVGFLEDMDGRPVRAAEWTSCEIVAEIDSDAEFVDFGVRSMGRGRVWVDEVSFDIVPEEQVTAVRNAIARIYARTDATLAAFRFSGTEAVATARKATQQGGFTLVELSRDTWTRGEDGWELTEHVALSRGYETAAPDPETVRAVAEDLKQYAVPLNGLETFRASAGCVAIHRADLAEGSGEQVLAAAGIAQWVLHLRDVPGGSALGRWLGEPHLFHGQPGTLAKSCDALLFLEASGAAKN